MSSADVIVVGAGLAGLVATRVLSAAGKPVPGLYAAGFGGGGVHGYRAPEGTFLGGCLLSGHRAGRALGYLTR